ncbi:MAG: hypothetical protein U1E05_12165 [Patescibacteria group bacterium]|nr:hypothetical protein [Patescibacteria group bacterium]
MWHSAGTATSREVRPVFYRAMIGFLLVAIVVTINQKRCESTAAIAAAIGGGARQRIEAATFWQALSLAMASLAILSCGMAIWRREKHHSLLGAGIVLLSLYVVLVLIMV